MRSVDDLCNEIAEAIRTRREELGYSQRDVAALSGISSSTLWKIENPRTSGVRANFLSVYCVATTLGLEIHISFTVRNKETAS